MTGLNGVNGQANNMMNFANQYMQTQQGMLDPLKQAGALQEMLQGQKQADLIGGRDYNMSQLQNYLNGLLPIAGLGGTQTGTQKTPGSSMFDKVVSGAGAGASLFSAFSDKRLKKNVKRVGKENGHNIYTRTWNDKAEKLGLKGSSKGVIAQEVMKSNPDAVTMDKSGYYKVNYSAIGIDK